MAFKRVGPKKKQYKKSLVLRHKLRAAALASLARVRASAASLDLDLKASTSRQYSSSSCSFICMSLISLSVRAVLRRS